MEFNQSCSKLTRRAHSCPTTTRSYASLIHNLSSSLGSFSDSDHTEEEMMNSHNSAAFSSFATRINTFFHSLSVLSTLLIIFLHLSFVYLRNHSPSLWYISLASTAIAAASLFLKKWPLSYLRFRFGPRKHVQWFIGDDECDVENQMIKIDGNGRKSGFHLYSNGDLYQGEFYRGSYSGSGVYRYARQQGTYEGDWVDGRYDGYGIEGLAGGGQYQGHYHRGLRHGFGAYKLHNGDTYTGEWLDGRSHGRGMQSCSDGSCFVGQFQGGAKHGLGYYRFSNGDRYAGEYFAEKIHGFGAYYFANAGEYYEGSWHEGQRQGFGAYTLESGKIISGEWDCGTLKNPLPLADPRVEQAMQSAQKALEQTHLLPSIEKQADKAIASAQQAAACARNLERMECFATDWRAGMKN